jgi:hypothetical protein
LTLDLFLTDLLENFILHILELSAIARILETLSTSATLAECTRSFALKMRSKIENQLKLKENSTENHKVQ